MTTFDLFGLAPARIMRRFRSWRHRRLEDHYLMCAEVEKRRADEHLQNARYFQTKAAIARSNRI